MLWKDDRRSENVEDMRSSSSPSVASGGIFILLRILPFLLRSTIGRLLLVIGVAGYFGARMLGVDLLSISAPTTISSTQQMNQKDQEMVDFVSVILADTEDGWKSIFQKMGQQYVEPKLVLFRGSIQSACGFAQSAMGPFYCPGDRKLYIDLAFYEEMKTKLGAPGDFAQAYVIAHEVGHHVQNLLGIFAKINQLQQKASTDQANRLSVRLELQADCFAGIWAHYANHERHILEAGDIDEALNAASAIGDDKLQKQSTGTVRPETFTHGTSAERVEWFKRGFDKGNIEECNTFNT